MSAYSEKQNKLYVLGGFDGWECLADVEVLDFFNLNAENPKFEVLPKMMSRVKNGISIMNEED